MMIYRSEKRWAFHGSSIVLITKGIQRVYDGWIWLDYLGSAALAYIIHLVNHSLGGSCPRLWVKRQRDG